MPTLSKKIDDHTDEHEKREQFDWFRIQAFDLLSEVTDRIDELEGLKKSAESTAQSVGDPVYSHSRISLTRLGK